MVTHADLTFEGFLITTMPVSVPVKKKMQQGAHFLEQNVVDRIGITNLSSLG